ncbi:MAG TPA: hypothetical protein GXZ74_08055 [Tissierellia bacterium]|nr:hypothetical protein [Tissierellia bacterium]
MATVLEAPPADKPELFDSYRLDDITVYVYQPLEFRGDILRIDLVRQLFAGHQLVAGELKLI